MSGDRVFIRDLRLRAVIGVGAHERARPQEIVIDVDAFVDAATAGRSDDPRDMLDYRALADAVTEHVAASRCLLVEALAEGIAALVIDRFDAPRVIVRVAKPRAVPLAGAAGVEIDRRRDLPR